jgi:hypothetical protein
MFEEEVNCLLRSIEERQPSKKKTNPSKGSISKFLFGKNTLKKRMCPRKNF